jgi:iron complex transport system substrate-binding protein
MRLFFPPLILLVSCATQPEIAPDRIVSNNPCVDAILAEVSDPAQIGAVSAWSHDPAGALAPLALARRYPAIGAGAEAVILAKPCLALVGAFDRTDALEKAKVQHARYGI